VLVGALIIGGFNTLVLDKLSEALARHGLSSTANVLTQPGNWKYLVFGLVLILMMRFRPEGILPSRRRRAELAHATAATAAGEAPKAER
jgi:branched-chain amino acid transport system permease protein